MSEFRAVIEWSTGKESSATFSSEDAAVAWLSGRVGEIERNSWHAYIRLFKRRQGAAVEWEDVTCAVLLPGFPMLSGS